MNQTMSINDHVSQVEGHIVSDMGGEKVMLSIENGKYYNLGEVGGDIWSCMKDPITIENLINSLVEQYDVEFEQCRDHVILFLEHLIEQGLANVKSV